MFILEVLIQSEKEGNNGRTTPDLTLYWDSWDSATKTLHTTGNQTNENAMQNSQNSVPSNVTAQNTVSQTFIGSDQHSTPPSTPSMLKGKGTPSLFFFSKEYFVKTILL